MKLRVMRKLEEYEYDVLPIFMYNSITQSEDELLDTSIVKESEYAKYIDEFGKEDDYALAWERNGRISGIIWTRMFDKEDESFGFIDNKTPEMTLSVLAGYNEQAIGKELIELLFNELRIQGYDKLSVSVDLDNDIFDVYELVGFERLDDESIDNRVVMIKDLES